MDCLFCKIVAGEIPSYKIYEDEYTLAFLDISNDSIGHTLVTPKNHIKNIAECDDKTALNVAKTVNKVVNHYINNCGFTGANVFNNCNQSAGQVIMHLHYHILPRVEGDKVEKWNIDGKNTESLENVCNKLKIK